MKRAYQFGFRGRRGSFQRIFDTRFWGSEESVSGPGSTLRQTETIRQKLPELVDRFGINSMIDAPCGDLCWMSEILPKMDITYIGGDIVPEVVDLAKSKTEHPKSTFMNFDIVISRFPPTDLWLCRDVLFHLPYADVRRALDNFRNSEVKYILVTTHKGDHFKNRNCTTGDFRLRNLFRHPFGFPQDKVLYRFDDFADPLPPREMVLFSREDLLGRKLI